MRKAVPTVLLWAVPIVLLAAALLVVASGILWAGPPTGGKEIESAASAEPVEPADNSYCLVCHTNYEEEKLTRRHQSHGVGCEKCHGPSVKHSGDEDGLTPPDIMYAKVNVNAMCMKCHVAEKMAAADGHQDVFVHGGLEGNCTDCHGKKHRMKVRTRIWDKTTRKLVKDDGVRMMQKDSPATEDAAQKSKHGTATEPTAEASGRQVAEAVEPLPAGSVFARSNILAWCIVPFDTKKRGPEERAAMLERLGIKKLAYDWRTEHIPTFDAELAALKRHGVEMTAWWFPGSLDSSAVAILDCIRRNHLHPQLWACMEGGPHLRWDQAFESTPAAQAAHVARIVASVKPIAAEAAKLGCQVALYNHGGWCGVPENQIQIMERLKQDGIANVGMVYTQHHGHGEIDRFAEVFPKMKPYLLAITLNGMIKDGDLHGHDLGTVPLGQGDQDLRLLRIIKESGWKGPVGIILEVFADAEARLQDNLDGLDWLDPQLDGKPAGPKPQPRSWHPPLAPQEK